MSEADKGATSILLPSSGVAVHSRDPATLAAVREIEKDWRFARVRLMIDEGDINTAITAYKEVQSPDLVIIQTETIDETLTGQLEDLASHCSADTAAIVIGPVNDVYLYRKLIEMGVSDYLVKPVSASILADILAKTLIARLGASDSRLIAFIGAKGGVGASALAQAGAWALSERLEQKVILIDAGGGWSSMSVGMGFEPTTTLAEAARAASAQDEDSMKRMLFNAGERLAVLASGGDVMLEPPVTSAQMEEIIGMLMTKYPVVVADISQAAPELQKVLISRAGQVVVVATPTLPALRLARTLINEIKEMRGGEAEGVDMIVNMQGFAQGHEVAKRDIELALEFPVSATIPFAPKVFFGAESQGKRIMDDKEGVQIVNAVLLPVLARNMKIPHEDAAPEVKESGGLLSGLMGRLKTK